MALVDHVTDEYYVAAHSQPRMSLRAKRHHAGAITLSLVAAAAVSISALCAFI